MDHMQFAALESAGLRKTAFERFADEVERIVGHSIDGSNLIDGYSLDGARDFMAAGGTAEAYALRVIAADKRLV